MGENLVYNYEWQLSWKTNNSFPSIFFRSSTSSITFDQENHFSKFAKPNYSPSVTQQKAKTTAVATHRKSYRWNANWLANQLIHRFMRKSLSTPASLINFLTQSLFFYSKNWIINNFSILILYAVWQKAWKKLCLSTVVFN